MTVEAPPTTEDPYYLQLLAEERPSSEALGLLNQIDQVSACRTRTGTHLVFFESATASTPPKSHTLRQPE